MSVEKPVVEMLRQFVEVDSRHAALSLESMSAEEAADVVRLLPPGSIAACLEYMHPAAAAALLQLLDPETTCDVLGRVGTDCAADIVRALPAQSHKELLEKMSAERRRELLERFAYPEDSAGRLMKMDFLAFNKDLKVQEVIARLRSLAPKLTSSASYAYVVGEENKLLGVLNMRDLLLADPGAAVQSVMKTDIATAPSYLDREELAHIARKTHYISLPVVDARGTLLGIVHLKSLLQTELEEATEDLQIVFGAGAEERPSSRIRFKISKRLPWLYINLMMTFLAASVVALFQDVIDRIVVLAVFLPVVANLGGNTGTQALAVMIRGLVTREVRPKGSGRFVLIEVCVGFMNGISLGIVTALAAWAWKGNPYLGIVLGAAMIANMSVAGLAGAFIPLTMKRLGFDPAQSSGIFLTTLTDVTGFMSFLGFAALWQDKLM
ncbi:MAG TPA: magnesium transporter [Planctomycetota bacterium]|jgi:magnesium transporter|nr:magnesium transporter [Planctomycetota bacterium]OQC20516.1 MAG: Magnesium transporter MgtE [Planctomycetes bacterium ADurb.Bin069]HNR97958.1 magnesium transporter [Planctomycetota bacterium]HNU24516.1 magnesium transporter [Planctomycetota bacterium]HOE29094.1 magnesium transporter [Planctomycetota bacterium]